MNPSEARHRGIHGLSLAVPSALAFGAAGPFSKAVLLAGALSPLRLAQFRITAAALVLLVIVGVRRWRRPPSGYRWSRADVALVLAYGALGFVAVQLCYFFAIDRLPVGVALLFEYTSVVIVAVYAATVQHRPQPRAVWIGAVLAVVGLVVLTEPWSGFSLSLLGALAGCGAAVCSAAYFLLGEHGTSRLPVLELVTYSACAGAVLLALLVPWWSFPFGALRHTAAFADRAWPAWILLAIVVLVGTVIAYMLGVAALGHLPSPTATVIATLEIVAGTVASWILLHEHLTTSEIVGGSFIFAGVIVVAERARISPDGAFAATIIAQPDRRDRSTAL